MKYKLTCKNQITKETEVIDYYDSVEQANADLADIWQSYNDYAITKPSPIITNEKGLSFCFSTTGKHEIYQVEKYDHVFELLSDIFKPINQN